MIRAVAAAVPTRRVGGFFSEEIRVRGERRGFALATFDGRRAVMAHVDRAGPPRVGKYGVDVEMLEAFSRSALAVRHGVALYLVDEIGKMECLSARFVDTVERLLESESVFVATVALRGGGFIDEVKRRRDVQLWRVSRSNRDEMPERVAEWVRSGLGS